MSHLLPLAEIAHARSGDKGNHANVAVIAYTPEGYEWLRANLTEEKVQAYFSGFQPTKTVRYEAPNLQGLNFVLYDVLAGGASRSLRIDTQGKTLGQTILRMPLVPAEIAENMKRQPVAGERPA